MEESGYEFAAERYRPIPPVTLEQLIHAIETPEGEPIQQVTDAMIAADRLTELGDRLVDHFVSRARESGASWADIGQGLGVSKQAAQKRFTGGRRASFRLTKGGLFTRFDEEGRFVVQTAVKHAHDLHSGEIGTLHVVIGLADPGSGRAAETLADLTGSIADLSTAARTALRGPKRPRKVKHLPFTDNCKKTLELALREAIRAESRSIGPEHILLGLLRAESSEGARLLRGHGVTRERVDAWIGDHPVGDG